MTAMGIFFLLAAVRRVWLFPGVVLMTVTYAGAVVARSLGFVLDGDSTDLLWLILGIEIAGLLLGLLGLWLSRPLEPQIGRG